MASHEALSVALTELFGKIEELRVEWERERAEFLSALEKKSCDKCNESEISAAEVEDGVRDNYLSVPVSSSLDAVTIKQAKQYCLTCGCTVNPVGHALRCKRKSVDSKKPALEVAAWLGDAMLLVFARVHLLCTGATRGEAHVGVERVVCNANLKTITKLSEFGLLCTPDFCPAGDSEAKGGTSVEAAFAMCPRFREFFVTRFFPGADCGALVLSVHKTLLKRKAEFSEFTPHSNVHGWCYRLFFTSESDGHEVECTEMYPTLGQLSRFVESARYARYVFQVGEFLHVEAVSSRESSRLMTLQEVIDVYSHQCYVGGVLDVGDASVPSEELLGTELRELLHASVEECNCRIHQGSAGLVPGEARPLDGVFLRAYLGEIGHCTASVETRVKDKDFLAIAIANDSDFRQYAQSGFYRRLRPYMSSRGVSLEDVGPRYLYLGLVRPRLRFRVARLLGPTPFVVDLLTLLNVAGAYKTAKYRFLRQERFVRIIRDSGNFSVTGKVYYETLVGFAAEGVRLRVMS